MEIFLLILFWMSLWMTAGVFIAFLKMFVFFRGPAHMIQIYLSHPKTQKQMAMLVQITAKKTKNIVLNIMMIQYTFAAIFMPLAFLELIFDVILFANYTPKTKNDDEGKQ